MRTKHFLMAIVLCCAESAAAWAALPPNFQRRAELQAILAHPQVIGAFKVSQPIDKIEHVEKNIYRVSAGGCHLDVAIVNKPPTPGLIGAVQFTVEPGKLVCP